MTSLTLLAFTAFLQGSDAKMDWKKDYASALQEAKKDNRYLVVHFTGPG